jgi:hypothetical protein
VQDGLNALFSAWATIYGRRLCYTELHCNECKKDERLYFLQLQRSVTQGNADSQQKVIKGHVANGELETSLCGVEHKGMGFTELSFRL